MAYELTQDVFVSLWARRDQLSIQVSLSGYLFGAMRNQIFKYINRSDVRARYLEDFLRFNQQRVDNSNQETIILHDLEQAVENSLSSLPARCQEIFRLSRYEHRSIREIADQLNISNRTVENQLHRALKHLKVELGDFMALAVFWWI